MEAIILTWNKEESNPLQVKPGEENSPGFLFFGNAPRKEKLKENAEVNTQQILVVYNTDTNTINAYWSFSTSYSIGHLSDIYRTFIQNNGLCNLSDVLRHRPCPYSRWHNLIFGLYLLATFHESPLVLG